MLADDVVRVGQELGLPSIAVSADISSPEPMRDPDGRPFAETTFRWLDPELAYWADRGFALRSALIEVVRRAAEPFLLRRDGSLVSWRPAPELDKRNIGSDARKFGVASAVVAPVRLPFGAVGAVVWATADAGLDPEPAFLARWPDLHLAALKFLALHADLNRPADAVGSGPSLSRREVQCLKWIAAGKTDAEVASIVGISSSTVRFHTRNAAAKLDVAGRAQAVRRASELGYIGASAPGRRAAP